MTHDEAYCEMLDRYYVAIQQEHWETKIGELNRESDRLSGLTCPTDECKCQRRQWPKINTAGRERIAQHQWNSYNRLVGN